MAVQKLYRTGRAGANLRKNRWWRSLVNALSLHCHSEPVAGANSGSACDGFLAGRLRFGMTTLHKYFTLRRYQTAVFGSDRKQRELS